MKDSNSGVMEHIAVIESQIREVQKELGLLIEKEFSIKNAGELEEIEREIIKTTDRLAGLILAQKVQQALESAELKTEANELIKSIPQKMKNQGPREVEIYPSRGGAVKVKSSYFSRKGKKK